MKLTDESPMPFGKYKGEKMANVPASYLKWIYDEWTLPNPRFGFVNNDVKEYIEENLDVIQEEIKVVGMFKLRDYQQAARTTLKAAFIIHF